MSPHGLEWGEVSGPCGILVLRRVLGALKAPLDTSVGVSRPTVRFLTGTRVAESGCPPENKKVIQGAWKHAKGFFRKAKKEPSAFASGCSK